MKRGVGDSVSGNRQFEGRTAEEAVARARKALGDSDALRCWKTRRGGVGGFFAREVFVASLTPPPGSETARGKGLQNPPRSTGDGRAPRSVSDGSARREQCSFRTPAPPGRIRRARGPPLGVGRSHGRSAVPPFAGDTRRCVRSGTRRGRSSAGASARGQPGKSCSPTRRARRPTGRARAERDRS